MVDYDGILDDLRARLAQVNEAIAALERIGSSTFSEKFLDRYTHDRDLAK